MKLEFSHHQRLPHLCLYTYGSPMVGDQEFVADFDRKIPDSYRHALDCDFVPMLPPSSLGYRHVRQLCVVSELGIWIASKPTLVTVVNKKNNGDSNGKNNPGGGEEGSRARLFSPGSDHSIWNYTRLLRRHCAVIEMVYADQRRGLTNLSDYTVIRLHDAWIKVMTNATTQNNLDNNTTKQTVADQRTSAEATKPPVIELNRRFVDVSQLWGLLSEILDKPLEIAKMIEAQLRINGREKQIGFSHLLAACYDLFFDPHSRMRRVHIYLRRKIERFDVNHDLVLEGNEVRHALEYLHVPLSETELQHVLVASDFNASGNVSYTELIVWILLCLRGKFDLPTSSSFSSRFSWLRSQIKFILDDSVTRSSVPPTDENLTDFDFGWELETSVGIEASTLKKQREGNSQNVANDSNGTQENDLEFKRQIEFEIQVTKTIDEVEKMMESSFELLEPNLRAQVTKQ